MCENRRVLRVLLVTASVSETLSVVWKHLGIGESDNK